jgi:peptide-methionine (S)-S-oxide reductase
MNLVCDLPGASLSGDRAAFPDPVIDDIAGDSPAEALAVLAGGCFWCVEAVLRELDGVLEVVPGYSGGSADTADYKTVCAGATDHAEVVRIRFDPRRVSYGQLLKVFFAVAHDPTQRDRQGDDRGRQYRSVIFHVDARQREIAQAYIRQLEEARVFTGPIVTEVVPLAAFHEAEAYHRNYAALHPEQPYIAAVAQPKVEKLRKRFGDKLKPGIGKEEDGASKESA